MARGPQVLLLAPDERVRTALEQMIAEVGIGYRASDSLTLEHVAFARRLGDAIVIAGAEDPLAELTYVRSAGLNHPILVFHESDASCRQLVNAGAVTCTAIPASADALSTMIRFATASAPPVPAPVGVLLDPIKLRLEYGERSVGLTRREYAVLECLLAHADNPVSIAELQGHAWGDELRAQSASQIVTVYIHQLRRKLRAVKLHEAIVTIRNFGYRFVPPPAAARASTARAVRRTSRRGR